ncbi:MAG: tripartite tricarboxylate transporter substrate binding protein [Burkholderiales bacterium]|nr:tripartite tricarboxylate transporter substrate binding protein [Burkholderiales bacterium]
MKNSIKLSALFFSLLFATAIFAQDFPTKPIKIIVPFPPGGATDTISRAVAERLQAVLNKPVIVENKAGASGNIGVAEVVRSAPDGYTLVMGAAQTLTINHQLFDKMGFTPQKDLAPIVVVASVPNVLVVANRLPAKNLQELIALAKANPGKFSSGSSSTGGTPHLTLEMFKTVTGTSIVHVPYKGSAPALQDLAGGQIEMMFDNLPAALPLISGGRVRPIGVTSLKRTASAPDIPTLDEMGLKGFETQGWFGLLAPAETPFAILEKLNVEVNKMIQSPEFRERLVKAGADPVGGSIDDFRQRLKAETDRWGRVIKEANVKAE